MHSESTSVKARPSVLLVDNQADRRRALREMIADLPYDLAEAASADEALRLRRAHEFAAVLIAVQCGTESGFAIARRLRAAEAETKSPIVFLADPEDAPRAAEAYTLGVVDFLIRPLVPEIVRAKISGLITLFQAVRDARRQAEQFRLLIEGTKDYAIFMLDPTGHIATWNPGAERIKGYRAEEIIGEHFSRFYPAEDVAAGKPARELEIAVREGKLEEEGRRVRKDGSLFWASVLITALWDENGRLRGFAKVTGDLTRRREAEEATRRLLQEEAARKAAEASEQDARSAEAAERRQREQLRITLESIGDAVIATDIQGRVTFLNSVAQQLTGWSAPEAEGQSLETVFHIVNEDSRRTVETPAQRVLREGIVVGLANRTLLIARDGVERPIADSAAPIRDEDGVLFGVVLVFRDVTEQRRALATRLHLAAIVESSDDAIISKDLEGNVISWNKGAEELYGYSADEIVGRSIALLIAPERPDELNSIMDRVRRGERLEHYETVRVCKNGRRVHVSVTISPIKDSYGITVAASAVERDISPTKRAAEVARFLADASDSLARIVDYESTLRRVAGLAVPFFADWCAVEVRKEDGSLRRLAVVHKDPAKVALAQEIERRFPTPPDAPYGIPQVMRTGRPDMMTHIPEEQIGVGVPDPDYRRMMLELGLKSYICVPLRARGQTMGVVTFVSAESGRHYDAADLAVAEDLAQRAGIAIDNALLYRELKEADQRKNDFLAMLSHELRNPLAPVRNALHILRLPDAGPEGHERARGMMQRQVEHLVRLVDDLLDVSRIVRGRVELRKEATDLAGVFSRAVETIQPVVDAQAHKLEVSLPDEAITLVADPVRLTQIVSNLLSNAAKYTEPGGRISLSGRRDGDQIVIEVRDTGVGIDPTLLPKIFDLFTQGERSLARSQGGLGLGLTLVKHLVELHGGSISASSAGPGKGSVFTVRVPATDPDSEAAASQRNDSERGEARPLRLLVVDDHVDAAESLAMLLQLQGHEPHVAHSGTEALPMLPSLQPDVVLLDIGLPAMDGYEVARRIRRDYKGKQPVLIAVTGYGQPDDRNRSRAAGFDHHLVKPVAPEELRAVLDRFGGRYALPH